MPTTSVPLVDPLTLARDLIARPSITPQDNGALDVLQTALETLGFDCTRLPFEEDGTARVDNLYAKLGTTAPNFCFAGHTDVVPPGDETTWCVPPFQPEIRQDRLYGRGAVDMKGAIAAFVAAVSQYLQTTKPAGTISLLITGDEEGDAVNGTQKMLTALERNNEIISHCLVGEPSNPENIGDMIKVGRRGSLNCQLDVQGTQGHVAYPHLADNPIPKLLHLVHALTNYPLDDGYEHFQPSNLEVTRIESTALASNVTPEWAGARFNIRFNPNWTGNTLIQALKKRLATQAGQWQHGKIDWRLIPKISGEAFLTQDHHFIHILSDAIATETGQTPVLSTSGGTSDARFIKNVAPVAEFGLVSKTMHKVDEYAQLSDITLLTQVYKRILGDYFKG